MRSDLARKLLLLLLLVVSVQPSPAPQLRLWSKLSSFLPNFLSLGQAEQKVEKEAEDVSQDVPHQDYQVLQSFEV